MISQWLQSIALPNQFALETTWTLLHFCWQGIAIATLAWMFSSLFMSPRVRHATYLAAMLAMVACPVVTLGLVRPVAVDQLETPESISAVDDSAVEAVAGEQMPVASLQPVAGESISTNPLDLNTPTPVIADHATTELSLEKDISGTSVPQGSLIERISPFALLFYAVGLASMCLRLACGVFGGRRLRKRATRSSDQNLLNMMRAESTRIGLHFAPLVAICQESTVPLVVGLVRPTILLPAALATGLTPEQLRLVLSHEMAHLRRFDLWINIFQRVVECIFFFHPAVWFVSRQLSNHREICCDDRVIRSGWKPLEYASMLVRLAELTSNTEEVPTTAAGLAASGDRPSQLRRRVHRLLNEPTNCQATSAAAFATLLAVIVLLVAPIAWNVGAQQPNAPENNAAEAEPETSESLSETSDAEPTDTKDSAADLLSDNAQLHGAVLDANNKLVPNATLEIYSIVPNFKLVKTVRTNHRGWFCIEDLPRTYFTVRASKQYDDANGQKKEAVAEDQRVDLRRGGDYLLVHLPQKIIGKDEGSFMTSGGYSMHGTFDAKSFDNIKARQLKIEARGRTSFEHCGWPADDRELPYGTVHCGIQAALVLGESDAKSKRDAAIAFCNVTHRVIDFDLEPADDLGCQFIATNRVGLKKTFRIETAKKIRKRRVFLRPGDIFECPVGKIDMQSLISDFDPVSLKAKVKVLGNCPAGALNQHVDDGVVQTGKVLLFGDVRERLNDLNKKVVARNQFHVRGRVMDGVTGEPIPMFRSVVTSFSKWHEKSSTPVTWQDHLSARHVNGNLNWSSRGYPRMRMRIEAEGYKPAMSKTFFREQGEVFLDIFMYKQSDVTGVVLDSEGKRLKNITVARGTQTNTLTLVAGQLRTDVKSKETNERGLFTFPPESDPSLVVAIHPKLGYAEATGKQLADNPRMVLRPWVTIKGTARDANGKPVENQIIRISSNRETSAGYPALELRYTCRSDKNGEFAIPQLADGYHSLTWGDNQSDETVPGCFLALNLGAGETREINIGQPIGTIVGRIVCPETVDLSNLTASLRLQRPRGFRPRITNLPQQPSKFYESDLGRHYEQKAKLADDGSFKLEGIPLGKYELAITLEEQLIPGGFKHDLAVVDDKIVDIGELAVDLPDDLRRSPKKLVPPEIEAGYGHLKGRFVLDGIPPKRKVVRLARGIANYGGPAGKPALFFDNSLVVNAKNRGIANVAIWIYPDKNVAIQQLTHDSYSNTKQDAIINSTMARFSPRIAFVRTGQNLVFKNATTSGQSLKVDSTHNPANPIISAGKEFSLKFTKEERLPISLSSAIHPWLSSRLIVKDHPYVAISNTNGEFLIPHLPNGTWKFQVWHEESGYVTDIKLGGKELNWKKGRFDKKIDSKVIDLGDVMVAPNNFE